MSSKHALCATCGGASRRAASAGATSVEAGASRTIALVMQVMREIFGGIGLAGHTWVDHSFVGSPSLSTMAPISVMPSSRGDRLVISRSRKIVRGRTCAGWAGQRREVWR